VEKTSRLRSRDPVASGVKCGPYGGMNSKDEVLGGISSIPLDLASFGGHNHGYGLLMRCSYYPQSLVQVRGAIREIEVWIWRS
jgi:hypothetical protein